MSQPIRKKILEQHPELEVKPTYTLLIDGNNLLRICMADTKVNSEGIHYGGIFQVLLHIKMLMKDCRYDYVYCFFDDSNSGILRYRLYHDYKANRVGKNYAENDDVSDYWREYQETLHNMAKAIYGKNKPKREVTEKQKIAEENFSRERDILMEYFEELFIRTYMDSEVEADDLIAYYVKNRIPGEKIVIVSTDNDLSQLICDDVCIYNMNIKKYVKEGNFKRLKGYVKDNVVLRKVLCGDSSDNIGNIKGLSENRLMELMPEIADRKVSLSEVIIRAQEKIDERVSENKKPLQWHENIVNAVPNKDYDGKFYEINRKLVDLSEPMMTQDAIEAMDSMRYAPMDPEGRSFENLYVLMKRDGIEELLSTDRFANFFTQFKEFADRERIRFNSNNS